MSDSPCVLNTSEYGWPENLERIMKAQVVCDSSVTSDMVSKKTMEVNPKHSTMTVLKRKAVTDEPDKSVRDLLWLLFDTSLLISGFNRQEPTQSAGITHRMVKLGLSIDDDEKVSQQFCAVSVMMDLWQETRGGITGRGPARVWSQRGNPAHMVIGYDREF